MRSPSGSSVLPPERAGSPGSLIVSFAGAYLRQLGGWIAVADLVRLLDPLGLTAPTVRQALMRLKSRGFLEAARECGAAGYRLTASGGHDLQTGDRRIFRFGQAQVSDGWVLAVFSVPESERALRHRLRSELGWLGFGTVAPGVWIAPTPLAESAARLLRDACLERYVSWFTGAQLHPEPGAAAVREWWDLDELRGGYERFLAEHRPSLAERAASGDQAFARAVRLIDDWRRFPRLDPGLPAELLPVDWPAPAAWRTFRTLYERWHGTGLGFVRDCVGVRTLARADS